MKTRESNNDFLSYSGTISRKNYVINMLILVSLSVCLSLINFNVFLPYIKYNFLFQILMYTVWIFKFIIVMSALSVIYRRLADIASGKSYQFNVNIKRMFIFVYVLPMIYIFCLRSFFDIIPQLITIIDLFSIFIIAPLAFITAIVISFIKSN